MRAFMIALMLLMVIGLAAKLEDGEHYSSSYISFETEHLSFELSDSLLVFNGLLTFSNISAFTELKDIYLPIIVDEAQLAVEALEVSWARNGEFLPYWQASGGFWFTVELPERSFETIRIRYRQKLTTKEAKYILLSASTWKKSLVYGGYELSLPLKSKVTHFPFIENSEPVIAEGRQTWSWGFSDFVPEKDIYIAWE